MHARDKRHAGDKGETSILGKRVQKDALVIEALGSLDEVNSWLGVCKTKTNDTALTEYLLGMQQDLFIIQAEVGGAKVSLKKEKVDRLEEIITTIDAVVPKQHVFCIPGGTDISAYLDYARTVARRAERSVVAYNKEQPVNEFILTYMNRLSSTLYAMARYVNVKEGCPEKEPTYK